ncbi:flagellar assembly protein FliH [Diaminobutyricimonas aerilata]|uniref:Flagellar assembly protein FliH n=1 Tax=Diaminobutyricimonas aerilata TaxID=1162967 RepID=A0A2M9CN37_9MICO|nr:FliH/SctL family protein [Diaminobutyricimonas aerilata]PJJ73288.1 flagellar assembly protein FliH [Diaminobutyricimonas aerilata]
MSPEPAFAPVSYPVLRDAETDAVAERARIRGHAEGYATGRRAADRELAAERARLADDAERRERQGREAVARAVAALDAARARVEALALPALHTVDASLTAAAIELAEAVLARELTDHPGSVRDRLRNALTGLDAAEVVAVRLHPADRDLVRAVDTGPAHPIAADPALAPGDVVVELADGLLDARIDAALRRARAALAEAAS